MSIPDDPLLWIVMIIIAGIVLALALWLGRGISLKKEEKGFSFEVKESPQEQKADISVARGAHIENSDVGDIAGVKSEGRGNTSTDSKKVDVLTEGKIKDSKVGDIAGTKKKK